jgi:hypothetical protein
VISAGLEVLDAVAARDGGFSLTIDHYDWVPTGPASTASSCRPMRWPGCAPCARLTAQAASALQRHATFARSPGSLRLPHSVAIAPNLVLPRARD